MTAATAADVAARLGGHRQGDNFVCPCPRCGKEKLEIKDGRVRLLVHCWSCGRVKGKEIYAELKRKGVLNGAKGPGNGTATETDDEKKKREEEEKNREALEEARRQTKIAGAVDKFNHAFVADRTPAETYLNSRLLMHRPVPKMLRYAPSVFHPKEKRPFPAVMAGVEHQTLGAVGIHCICLNPLDPKSKLTIKVRKISFGAIKGGAIRLFQITGSELALGGGIEDCLAFQQSTGIPAWATPGEDFIASFEPPPVDIVSSLILLEDQDDVGRRCVAAAAKRFLELGYRVRVARPLTGKDINEALLKIGLTEPICEIEDYNQVPSGGWYSRCIEGADGRTLSNLANAVLALRADPAFVRLFSYDAFADVVVIRRQVPRTVNQDRFADPEPQYPRPLTDNDISHIQEWLQLAGLATLGAVTTYQAVEAVAREHSFHPVREYLEGLTWDGIKRVDTWLRVYLGVDESEYSKAVGRMHLIAMVARIFEPGCQCDYMPILEGDQGEEKSKALRTLASPWFSDNLPDISSKDAKQHLPGKWLIEIPDLHLFKTSGVRELKAFQTMREDQYRPPYGRKEVYRKRQNVFAGTTNEQTYLEDPTGGRRYWPLVTTVVDVEKLGADRDQLFAEALVLYRAGEYWWPDRKFEKKYMMPEQAARFEADAWEQPIADHINKQNVISTTVYGLAKDVLGFVDRELGTADQRRITAILGTLGWKRGKRGSKGERLWEAGKVDPWKEPIASYLTRFPTTTIFQIANEALKLNTLKLGRKEQRRITTILEGLGWSRANDERSCWEKAASWGAK